MWVVLMISTGLYNKTNSKKRQVSVTLCYVPLGYLEPYTMNYYAVLVWMRAASVSLIFKTCFGAKAINF